MVNITDETANELEQIAENKDVEVDVVQEKFKEKYEEIQERSSLPEDRLEELALRTARTNLMKQSRVPTDEVEMLTIGGSVREWSNGDTFVGKALVDENPDEEAGRAKISTLIIDEDDVNLTTVYDAFSDVGNVVRGEFSVSEADIEGFLVLNSSEDTEIDVTKPDDRGPLLEEIRDAVPKVSIEDITDNLSATTRNDDGDVYPASFGVDIRRIEGDIYDGYKNPDKGTGIYTIRDETVFDEDDVIDSGIHDAENANENATPGLTCFIDPDKMECGSDSVVEFFGTITTNEDAIPVVNVDGVNALYATEFDGYTDESSSDSRQEQVDSNVDRTEI